MFKIATQLLNFLLNWQRYSSEKSGGNADTFIPILPALTLGFVVAIQAKLQLEIQFVKNVPGHI